MDKINIYGPTDILVLSINVDDTSYRYKAIMAENSLNLKFSLPEYIQIEVDSYVDYKAERYFLFEEQTFVKNNTRNFEYNLTLLTHEALLRTKQFKFFLSDEFGNTIPPLKVKGSFTGKPLDFLNLIVRNMNDGDTGWVVGSYIEGEQKTLSFNQITCAEFLKQVCDEYKTEYDVVLKTINMGKVEKDKANPLSLSYGKGNGLKSGVKRNNGEASKINRIYVQGGSTNIDKSKYRISNMVGSDILKIPANASKVYNGVTYVSDADGTYVQRSGLTERVREGSYENTDIFPQRIGTVSSVVTIDASKNLYDIVDSSIPVDLNYSDYMIAGEVWTIIFQTGALAGQEFDLANYYHTAIDTHAARTFGITPKKDAGIAMPSTTLIPAAGDKYIVFHISMPQSYISTAETSLFDKAVEVLYENEIADYAFDGELDPIYTKANWLAIGSKLNAGNFVSFTDPDFSTEPVIIRINGVREYVNKPYEPSIELNNKTSSKSISSKLKELDSDEVRIDNSKRESISYTKRRWRDALETMTLLEDALKNFSAGINPIWVQTMSILVGEESLQFRFVDDKTTPESVNDSFVWSNTTKVFGSSAAIIQHMTIGIKNLSSSHAAAEYLFWDIPAYTSPVITDLDPFYIYLKCSKTSSAGEVLMSKTPFDLDPNDGFYYFLSATLGSEVEGERSLITTYGFTEITPGRITLDKIVSPDGYQFWDMLTHAFRIGNATDFLEYSNGTLKAQKLLIQSPTGDTAYVEIYVGNYSGARQYYPGEYFYYTDGILYICKLQPPTVGVLPTNTTYFREKTDSSSAKNALASQIGNFASYNDYVAYVSTYGRILMQGGYINANLIDVDALVANNVLVTEMANIAGTYFETDGVTFTQKNGITLPANINSIDTSLDMNPQSLPDIASFLTASALTGTTNLPALSNAVIEDRETILYQSTQYMTIPSGVTSIKNNSFTISGSITMEDRAPEDTMTGFVYKCDVFALFYNGTTFVAQSLIGQYSLYRGNDLGSISYTVPVKSLSVPNGANRVYLQANHTLFVNSTAEVHPYGSLTVNAVNASAIFYNATGVYKSRISPDGYALARDSSNYFHVKANSTKVLLSFQGDIASNSIAQKLLTMSIAASGLIVNVGGYMKKAGLTIGSSVTKVSTGVWRIQHDINSNYGLVPSNYTIHLTIQNGGYNIPGFMYVSAYDTTSYNWTEVRAMNTSGALIDTEFYITFMRI